MSDEKIAPKIEARENGPLMVRGVTRMTGADGQPVDCKPVMALCRCGRSGNKPFCDGSHKEGFSDEKGTPAGRDRLIAYEGAEATVFYNPMLCSHAAECGRLASHIFNPAQKPWVQPDKGSVEELAEVMAACPSGALSFRGADGMPDHRVTNRAEVTVEPNGPYWVQGVAPPELPGGDGQTGNKYVLCRCGLSGNKPFCDGSHRDAGWKSDD
jgi:CDGSH-type Zn-finger protein